MIRNTSILVADDEESDLYLLELAAKRSGLSLQLTVAHNGQEVVDYLEQSLLQGSSSASALPNLLLLDLKMPCMSGFDVLKWLTTRPQLRELPVLVLSSSCDELDMRRARELGAREYLVKPTGLADLTRLLLDIARRYLPGA